MARFNSSDGGTWYYFDPTNEVLGGVCLRLPTEEEYSAINKVTLISRKKKAIRGVLYEDVKYDEAKQAKLRWRAMIVDWKNVCLDDSPPLDCTDENKDKMMQVSSFKVWIGSKIEKLIEETEELKEALVKNSKDTSDGSVDL